MTATRAIPDADDGSVGSPLMETYVVRLWLADRPGALGQVASRIGAVRGDVVGIEILERGGDRVVDDLVVALPEPGLVDLLVAEIGQVDGVAVESVRRLDDQRHDPGVWALELGADLVQTGAVGPMLHRLADEVQRWMATDWVTVLDLHPASALVSMGDGMPSPAWLAAFIEGSRHLGPHVPDRGPQDVAWAMLDGTNLALAAGGKGHPLRWRERRQLSGLARVAGGLVVLWSSAIPVP